MHPLLRLSVFALLAGGVVLFCHLAGPLDAQTADPKAPGDTKTAGTSKDKDSAPKKIPLDKLKIPPGGVVVLVEETKDPRTFLPHTVLLTPEAYKDLTDRIAVLEKQLKPERKLPHTCNISAAVEGDSVRVTAELHFQVDQARSSVLAGFRGTQLSEAKIRTQGVNAAWQPAVMDMGPDGYIVQVDKAGDYEMIVELKLALASGNPGAAAPGLDRSFELVLPGAAVTVLTLDLPDAVRELHWNKVNVEKPLPPATEQKHWKVAVGKLTQLAVAWKEPLAAGGTGPQRTARAQVSVRIDNAQVTTTVELMLNDQRAKAKEWRLWLPLGAKVKVSGPEGIVITYKTPPAKEYQHILTLSKPTDQAIKVAITLTALRGKSTKVAVGPFSVQDAVEQRGTIEVKQPGETRKTLRLSFQHSASVLESEPPRDQPSNEVVAVFKYNEMPIPPKNATPAVIAKALVPSLEIEWRPIQGKVETSVEHTLKLRETEQGWQIAATCKIIAKPMSDSPVDYLDIQLPRMPIESWLVMDPGLSGFPGSIPWIAWANANQQPLDGEWIVASAGASVETLYPDTGTNAPRKLRLKWSQPQSKEFAVTLEGRYTLSPGTQKVHLELPRPLATNDRGAKGTITVAETLELLTQDGGPELPVPEKHVVTAKWDRAQIVWDLAWRPHRPDFPIQVTTDVTILPDYAHVRQQLSYDRVNQPRGQGGKPALLRLRLPVDAKNLKVTSGGKLVSPDREKQLAWIDPTDVPGKGLVVLEYDFALPLPLAGKAVLPDCKVPLIWPEQATHVETKLRLWCQPGVLPMLTEASLADLAWKDVGTEIVPNRTSLPVRVLVSDGQNLPLVLRLEAAPALLANVVVDRVLVQVNVDEEGTEQYRARFLLTKLHVNSVDVRLPVAVGSLDPKFMLDGKAIPWQARDSTGLVAKLNVDPSLYGKPVILEVTYQLGRGQPTKEGLWHTTLDPPVLEGQVFLGKVRWQVTLPPSMLAVAARGDATTDHEWQWRGWLPALAPAVSSSDLELWLTGQELPDGGRDASLVSGRATLETLRLFRVSRAMWFLVCSGVVLLAGLLLYLWPPPPLGWLAVLASALVAVALIGWLWPAMLPAMVYGAAPGILVLGVLLLLQWVVQERYKRKVLYLPGFKRVKAGSPLLSVATTGRGHDPSTIDAPMSLRNSHLGQTSNS